MAAKGGGSWKVAYADFVTAMMAFFLVMWISSQDQKVKQAVSYYFTDPLGASKKPNKSGSVTDVPSSGAVPQSESVAVGRGRASYNEPGDHSRPTKLVSDWIHGDPEVTSYWRKQAALKVEAATKSEEVRNKQRTVHEVATQLLAKQLREEIGRGASAQAKGVYQDLLFAGLSDVNWAEIAEDLLGQ